MRHTLRSFAVALLLIAAGCSDETIGIDKPVESVHVSAAAPQVEAGQTITLTAAAKAADGTALPEAQLVWSVNDTTFASLTVNGRTATLKGKKAGFVVVTVKAVNNKQAVAQVEVTETAPARPAPLLYKIEPSAATVGSTGAVVRVTGANFTPQTRVLWNGQPKVTTYIHVGELQVIVTPLDISAPGAAEVKVQTPAPGGGTSPNAATFTIYGPAVSIDIGSTLEQVFWTGEQVRYTPIVKDALGRVLTGVEVTWATSNPAVATVDAHGNVEGRAAGTTQVSARINNVVGASTLTVVVPPNADIIFDALENGVRQLFIVRPGPVLNRQKILPEGTPATQPAVTRDGQRIAFVGIGGNGSQEIFTVNRDGSDLRQLTFDAAVDDMPAWSPDGTKLVFRSRRNHGYSDIFMMYADGSEVRNITDTGVRAGGTAYENPAWSPDGKTILYSVSDEFMTPRRSSLLKREIDGAIDLLTKDPQTSDHEPAFSPDGSMVAVRRQFAQFGEQIAFINPVDGTQWVFINYPGFGQNPAWSPDGGWLAFESSPGGSSSRGVYLWQMNTINRKGVGVGIAAGNPAHPAWIRR